MTEGGSTVGMQGYATSVMKDEANRLFPVDRLVGVLKGSPKPPQLDHPIEAMWDAAVEFARQYTPAEQVTTPP